MCVGLCIDRRRISSLGPMRDGILSANIATDHVWLHL